MSATPDFSRRFFADFIASRIRAWAQEEGEIRPTNRAAARSADGDPTRLQAGEIDDAPIDEPRGLLPGLGSPGA